LLPKAICFEQSIGRDDELSHECSDGDLGWFASGDHLLIFGLCDDSYVGRLTTNEMAGS